MNSKQIAKEFLAPKLDDPKMIFFDLEILKSILFWARDCAREFFGTQKSKMFLIHYIDDVGPFVEEYFIKRANKMYKNAVDKKNSLFNSLYSSEKVIDWIICRYINVFLSLTTNKKYKNHIDISKLKIPISDDIKIDEYSIEDMLEFEKVQKLPKEEIVRALKFIWEDFFYDYYLDKEDIQYLCEKLEINIDEIIVPETTNLPKFKKEQVENSHFQLAFIFESEVA